MTVTASQSRPGESHDSKKPACGYPADRKTPAGKTTLSVNVAAANIVRVSNDGSQLLASHLLGSPTCRRNSGRNIAYAFGFPARVPVAMVGGCLYSGSGLWVGAGGPGGEACMT
jgi:hypothetical protein